MLQNVIHVLNHLSFSDFSTASSSRGRPWSPPPPHWRSPMVLAGPTLLSLLQPGPWGQWGPSFSPGSPGPCTFRTRTETEVGLSNNSNSSRIIHEVHSTALSSNVSSIQHIEDIDLVFRLAPTTPNFERRKYKYLKAALLNLLNIVLFLTISPSFSFFGKC